MEGEAALLKSLQETLDSLKRELERLRAERAYWIEQAQAHEQQLDAAKTELARQEAAAKAAAQRAGEKEKELLARLDQAVERERMLRLKFEEELARVARQKETADAEAKETLALKERELSQSLALQREAASRAKAERARYEEAASVQQTELAKLRSVLEALDEKLVKDSARRAAGDQERIALERLVAALFEQNLQFKTAIERGFGERDLTKEIERIIENTGGSVRELEARFKAEQSKVEELRKALAQRDEALRAGEAAAQEAAARHDADTTRLSSERDALAAAQGQAMGEKTALERMIASLQQELVIARTRAAEELENVRNSYEDRLRQMKAQLEEALKRPEEAAPAAPAALPTAPPGPSFWERLAGRLLKPKK